MPRLFVSLSTLEREVCNYSDPPPTKPAPSPRGRAPGIRPPCGGANFQLGGLSCEIFFIIAAALAAGCQLQARETQLGAAYFQGYGCVQCHTVAGRGGGYGPDLTFVGFRKSREWLDLWLKSPHAWKRNTVMPDFHLPDHARSALVEYLAALKGEAYRASPPWDRDPSAAADPVKRGEALFNKLGCAGCHGNGGVGGHPNNNVAGGKIPALLSVADGYSKEELKTKIKVGVPEPAKDDPTGPKPMIHMPSWGEVVKDDELDALAEYLISLKPKTAGSDGW